MLAHELSHVLNRDILISTVAATVAGAISMLANMAQWGMMFGGSRHDDEGRGTNPIALILTIILAPLAAMLIQMAVSRSREYQADASGAQLTRDPEGLASALGKLGQASRMIPMNANPVDRSPLHREPAERARDDEPVRDSSAARGSDRPAAGDARLDRPGLRHRRRGRRSPGACGRSRSRIEIAA